MSTDWRSNLEVWLAPFLAALGHKAQRAMCPAYIASLTDCIISSVPGCGTVRHLRLLCGVMLTIWWAASVHG